MTEEIKVTLAYNAEFIKLAKSMRDAQKDPSIHYSQKAQRRARSLEQLFDAKLDVIEKEVARLQQKHDAAVKTENPSLFDVKKVN